MLQLELLEDVNLNAIVNVASVPQRSPFRYPGGKTWLIPRIRQWLVNVPTKPTELIEPFAGGGIVSLTVAFENLADHVLMVERDEQVAAVWETILGGDAEWLADRIINFEVTPQTVQAEFAKVNLSCKELAFQTILRNRVNHGGIMAPGSGVIKHGEGGKGIKSRWYPDTLRKRILAIDKVKDRIQFIRDDGLEVMERYAQRADVMFFIDPPYTAAGKMAGRRLYTYNELDHDRLFSVAKTLHGDFLMTYDHADGVKLLAEQHGFDTQAIAMKNTHHAAMTEFLIGRNLNWVRKNHAV